MPEWTLTATALTLAIGFPIAAIFAWVFQLTPVGVVPKGEEAGNDIAIDRSRLVHHIDLVIIAILLCVVAFLTWGKVFPTLGEDEFVPVAVMPFENLDSDPNNGYLGAGIADDIRSRLHDVPQLRIAARSSSIALSGKDFDVKVIGDRLNVSHVLEGTYRRIGDRVRLNVQLVDGGNGLQQWSGRFDGELDDVFELQDQISSQIVR